MDSKISRIAYALIIVLLLVQSPYDRVYAAATRTWTGLGGDGLWSTCANWSASACPVSGDTVIFDGTSSADSVLDQNWIDLRNAGLYNVASLSINAGYGGTLTLNASFQTTGAFTLSAGNFNATDELLDINGNFTMNAGANLIASSASSYFALGFQVNGGTFDANGGILYIDGGTGATINCNNIVFNAVRLRWTSGSVLKTIGSNCTLPVGTSTSEVPYGRIGLSGKIQGSGTFYQYNRIYYYAGAALEGFTGYYGNTKEFYVQGASLDFSNYTTFDNIYLGVSSGSIILPSAGATRLLNFGISGTGSITASSGNTQVSGKLSYTGGTFNHNNGTMLLTGTNQTISGALTFNNLSKTVTSAATLTFPASTTTTIQGALTLKGAANNLLSLRSSVTDTQFLINPQGTRDVKYVDVKDSNNLNSSIIYYGPTSINSNNNSNWSPDSIGPLEFSIGLNDGLYFNHQDTSITFATSDNLSGISYYTVSVDSGVPVVSVSPYAISGLAAGNHLIEVIAYDVAGNSTTINKTVTVDTTVPSTFSLLTPLANDTTNVTMPTFSWDASSDAESGLSKYQLYLDDTLLADNIAAPATTYAPTTGISEGTHSWYVVAIDVAGNTTTSNTSTINIDTTAPNGTIKLDSTGNLSLNTATINISATDPISNNINSSVGYMRLGESIEVVNSADWESYSTSKTWTFSGSSRVIYAQFKDLAGNISAITSSNGDSTTLSLLKLGTINFNEKYGHYYYTGHRPTFTGIASANSKVVVTIQSDPITCTTTADTNGNWSCTPSVDIPNGDHTVTIQSVGTDGQYTLASFKLGINIGLAATGDDVKRNLQTLIYVQFMIMLLYFGVKYAKNTAK